jgi:hypothetical protein
MLGKQKLSVYQLTRPSIGSFVQKLLLISRQYIILFFLWRPRERMFWQLAPVHQTIWGELIE